MSLPDPRPVRVEMSKWGERPHWSFDGLLLGEDEWGDWIGVPAGVLHERPGARFHSAVDTVTLAPREGWYAATFHAPGIWASVYVDLATPPVWDGDVLRSVDLDLDVVRTSEGRVYVDDEDEFEEHRVAFGYPDEVQAAAREWCGRVHRQVVAGATPYDGHAQRWLDHLAATTGAGCRDRAR
ncbi:hypothetical protein JOE61_002931 [Nocardioides salarius]|uniref:DUF402 domain-containing protein n=1 Tax=Nocardioides salarius TaxID=374513 RepID=A0ABS2MDC5_9ACTN|nr:DUF402 domain-containing protein [Nocardioides salarius]MBM7509117.1 hypothetical protein [Nocardioides salarius]